MEEYMRVYKKEEMDSMNEILGKPYNNKIFTKEELELMNTIDLFNKKVVNVCKIIWKNKDDAEKLEHLLKILNESRCSECM